MAIDPRISLAAQAPQSVSDIFRNALTNIGTAQAQEQQQQQAPFQNQLLQLQAQEAQRQSELQQAQMPALLQQAELAASPLGQLTARQQQKLDLATVSAKNLQPLFASNSRVGVISGLTALRDQMVTLKGGANPQELKQLESEIMEIEKDIAQANTPEGFEALRQENQQFLQQVGGQQQRVTASKILDDGTTIQSLSTGGTNVISPQGQILTGNDRKKALDEALKTKVEQKGDIAQAVSDVKVKEAIRLEQETETGKQAVEKGRINIDETKIKNEQQRQDAISAKNSRRAEADNAVLVVQDLLNADTFSSAFGRFNNAPPEGLRTQANIDARAKVDQVVGLLSLESRQKLKGQGTITDSEAKTLERSATVLTNPLISDDVARKELRRVERIFQDASDRNQLKQETKDQQSQQSVQQPTVIRFDAQGNIIQ